MSDGTTTDPSTRIGPATVGGERELESRRVRVPMVEGPS